MDDADLWADAPRPPWRAEDGSIVDPLLPPVMAGAPAKPRPSAPRRSEVVVAADDWPTWPAS